MARKSQIIEATPAAISRVTVRVHPEVRRHRLNRNLYGHFAEHIGRCVERGIWVGDHKEIENEGGIRLDTVELLARLELPVLRWPGGCFADNYHWQDGIGPREGRKQRHNLWWNQSEDCQFGTDQFMRFCKLIGTEPYFCANVGSGTVQEAASWVEYCNSAQDTTITRQRRENGQEAPYGVKYWGVGNENWGCGGSMRPEYYADLYRQYATYMRQTAGPGCSFIASGSHAGIPDWEERFLDTMKGALHLVDYLAIHIYSAGGISDIAFKTEDYYRLIGQISIMDRYLKKTIGLARAYSWYGHPIGVVLDEWGTWYKEAVVESGMYQDSTMMDGLFAAASFHCFHEHGEDLAMTNMAQTVNVLQALVLTKGKQAIATPTYHVYDLFKPHRDGWLVASETLGAKRLSLPDAPERDSLSVSCSVNDEGSELFISLVNLDHAEAVQGALLLRDGVPWKLAEATQLGGMDLHSHNTFEEPQAVRPMKLIGVDIKALELPMASITTLRFEKG